jgi:hypothetical protein
MAYETTTPRGTPPPHRRGTGGIWMALIGAAVVIAGIWLIWAWWDTEDEGIEDEYGVVEDPAEIQDQRAYQPDPEPPARTAEGDLRGQEETGL